jgi:hypothetical protein
MSKAQQFLDLQAKVNQEIDELGQATNESANQLESLSNELTDQEIDEVIELLSRDPNFKPLYL